MRRSVVALAVLFAVAAAACGGDEPAGPTAPVGETGGGATGATGTTGGTAADCEDQTGKDVFTVELADFEIIPACLIVTGEQGAEVTNSGNVTHTFTVLDTGIDVEIGAGETSSFDPTGLDPGTYELQCQIHPSMIAELRVE
jgi:plastocyanin